MWTLIKKESLENILTVRFAIGFLACNLLFGITTYVLVQNYNLERQDAQSALEEADREKDNWTVYSQVRPVIVRLPPVLSVFGSGADYKWGTRFRISHTRIPVLADDRPSGTSLLGFFSSFSHTGIVQVFVSLLGILFAFDAFSGEKEKGSLRLIIATGVKRGRLLTAKFVGGVIALSPVLIAGFVTSLLITLTFSPVAISQGDWIRLGAIIFLELLYGALFVAVGMLISAFTHRSAVSLVLSTVVWIVWVLILPNAVSFISKEFGFEEDLKALDENTARLDEEYRTVQGELSSKIWQNANIFSMDSISEGRMRFRALGENAIRYISELVPDFLRQDREYSIRRFNLENDALRRRLSRIEMLRTIQRLSPASAFGQAVHSLAGSDTASYLHFVDEAKRCRNELISYVDGKGGFNSRRWFTDQPPSPGYREFIDLMDGMSRPEFHRFMMESAGTPEGQRAYGGISEEIRTDPRRKLDLSDMPRFAMESRSISEAFAVAQWDILIVTVYLVSVLAVAWLRILFYDVR
jgi:ABC-type transport system involved in multi-copper enzyme maturation permease subunit